MWIFNRMRSLAGTGDTQSRHVDKARRAFRPAPDRLETREVLTTITALAAGSPALAFANPLLNVSRNAGTFPAAGANNGIAGGAISNFNRGFTTPGGSNNVNPNLLVNGGRSGNNGLFNGLSQNQFRNANPGGLSNGFGASTGPGFNNGQGGINIGSPANNSGAPNGLGGVNIGGSNNGFGAASGVRFNNGFGGTNIGTNGNGTGLGSNNPFSQFASSNRFSTGNGLNTFNSGGFTGLRF